MSGSLSKCEGGITRLKRAKFNNLLIVRFRHIPFGWVMLGEQLEAAGISWKVIQELDNFDYIGIPVPALGFV